MDIIIRDATADDAEQIAQLGVELVHHHTQYIPYFEIIEKAAIGMSEFLRKLPQDPNSLLIVAETEGRIVGYILGSIFKRPPSFVIPQQGEIWALFVSEDYRRQGVGRNLVEQALRFFREKEIKFVDVKIASRNGPSIGFWKKMGIDSCITVGKLEP